MKPKMDNTTKVHFECVYKCRRCNEIFTNGIVTIPVDNNNIDFLRELYIDDELEVVSYKTIIHRCEGLRKPIYGVAELIEFKPYKV